MEFGNGIPNSDVRHHYSADGISFMFTLVLTPQRQWDHVFAAHTYIY